MVGRLHAGVLLTIFLTGLAAASATATTWLRTVSTIDSNVRAAFVFTLAAATLSTRQKAQRNACMYWIFALTIKSN